jgi:hypothetical protein
VAQHRGLLRLPHLDPSLDLEGLGDPLLHHGRGLQQHPDLPQPARHQHQAVHVLHVGLGQEPVDQVDPMLVVAVVRGEVGQADLVVDAVPCLADDGDHVVARRQLGHVRADLPHHAEPLVAEDEVVVAGRRGAVVPGIDLLVRPVQADPQDVDLDPPAARHVVERRLRMVVADAGAVRGPRDDGERFHSG